MERRKVDVVVMSDMHLGTYGCHAKEIVQYLRSIQPQVLVLNGDIIDGWQFSKRYFPVAHMQVIKEIMSLLSKGSRVIYITGNHDEMLRRFENFSVGDFHIVNKLVIHHSNNKKSWIFHGDVFDVTMQYSKWLAKLGAVGYDLLIGLNAFINYISKIFGYGRISLSKKIKNSVKNAVKYINSFEQTAATIAVEKGYDYVICGHIHQPCNRIIRTDEGKANYLNSGDWIENLSALEYQNERWNVYYYQQDKLVTELNNSYYTDEAAYLRTTELFKMMMEDFVKAS